jgi:hypothetical protein
VTFSDSEDTIYECSLCSGKHLIPIGGLGVSQRLHKTLLNRLHLSDMARDTLKNLDEIDLVVKDARLMSSQDPASYIYEHVYSERNKIDLRRERLIKRVNDISDAMLAKLKKFEEDCKERLANLTDLGKN